jgi:hypothetical protein
MIDGRDDVLGDERDDDARDGLSPWAHASRERWEHSLWLESLDDPAEEDRRSTRRAWEAKWLRAFGLTDVQWEPAETCPLCDENAAPPPSGVRVRCTPKPAGKPRPRRKPPTLKLV